MESGYLLDTNICSFILKRKPEKVLSMLRSRSASTLSVSVVTVYELFTGCEKSPNRNSLLTAVRAFLEPFVILPFTERAAQRAAQVRAALEKKGTPIGPYDILIAAQALDAGFMLVTNNTREFRRIGGLALEDWTR